MVKISTLIVLWALYLHFSFQGGSTIPFNEFFAGYIDEILTSGDQAQLNPSGKPGTGVSDVSTLNPEENDMPVNSLDFDDADPDAPAPGGAQTNKDEQKGGASEGPAPSGTGADTNAPTPAVKPAPKPADTSGETPADKPSSPQPQEDPSSGSQAETEEPDLPAVTPSDPGTGGGTSQGEENEASMMTDF